MRIPNWASKYLYALAISVAGVILQSLVWQLVRPHAFHFMHPSVFLSSYVGGLGPGIFATLFCTVMAYIFFISTEPGYVTGQAISQVLVFISLGIMYAFFNNYLRHTKEKLARSLSVRDEFLSIASHELKTPITTLVLQLEIARMKIEQQATDLWPGLAKYFDKSQDQANKLVGLVDELLNVTRLEAGKIQYAKEHFDFSLLVKETIDHFAEQLELNRTPATYINAEPVWVVGDRTKLEQVVTNLLTNAMKYGNGKPVRVTVIKEAGLAKLIVQDQGIGIAEDKHRKIFERFERAVSARSISGLGLGLFIANSIVTHHNGRIQVASELDRGSTFTVELPAEA